MDDDIICPWFKNYNKPNNLNKKRNINDDDNNNT